MQVYDNISFSVRDAGTSAGGRMQQTVHGCVTHYRNAHLNLLVCRSASGRNLVRGGQGRAFCGGVPCYEPKAFGTPAERSLHLSVVSPCSVVSD